MTRKRHEGGSPVNHLEHSLDVGPASLLPLAREAVLNWHLQEGAGVIARPRRCVRAGMVVDLWLDPVWPISPRRLRGRDLKVPVGSCEVLEIIDEPRAAGFVYRTLPGHLESGEQTFLVSVGDNDRLVVSIVSDSVPGHPLLRAFAPISVAAQRMMARRYADGLRRILRQSEHCDDE